MGGCVAGPTVLIAHSPSAPPAIAARAISAILGVLGVSLGMTGISTTAFYRGGDLAHQFRILAHGHAVAAGVGTGQVQLQPVRYRCQDLCHLDKFLDAAAENRGEQKPVGGHPQLGHQFRRLVGSRVGQAYRVDETAGRVLAQHRLAVTSRGLRPILLVVTTPTSGIWSKTYWMMGVAVVTIPEGIVKGPERVLPKSQCSNSRAQGRGGSVGNVARVYWFGPR